MAYGVSSLSKAYGSTVVLDGLSADFPASAVSVVLGPSGCGKTTLLNILAGLDTEYHGQVQGFDDARPSYAFQEDRLLPWLSALDNIGFVLAPFMDQTERNRSAMDALSSVGLEREAGLKPAALSGGMRKRVALARAFAYPSDLLFLDEPFSSLDLKTRIAIMDLFLDLRKRSGKTAVLVTHDVREAIYVGDHLIVLSDKPSQTRDVMDLALPRSERSYASPEAADVEARLYSAILS